MSYLAPSSPPPPGTPRLHSSLLTRSRPTTPLHHRSTVNSRHQQASTRLFEIALQAVDRTSSVPVDHSTPMTTANENNIDQGITQVPIQAYKSVPSALRRSNLPLTPEQWQLLTDYHEHELFNRTRGWGFCMAIFGVGITLFGIGSPAWKWIGDDKAPYELGLWVICEPVNSSCKSIVYHLKDDWKVHTAIICFLVCACLFGLLGLGLTIAGACRSALTIRLYYYHSAGECFLVSSLTTSGALIIFPLSIEACIRNLVEEGLINISPNSHHYQHNNHHDQLHDRHPMVDLVQGRHHFAYAYYIAWLAVLLNLASFTCMNLDLIIQSCVKPPSSLLLTTLFYRLPNFKCRRLFARRRRQEEQQHGNQSHVHTNGPINVKVVDNSTNQQRPVHNYNVDQSADVSSTTCRVPIIQLTRCDSASSSEQLNVPDNDDHEMEYFDQGGHKFSDATLYYGVECEQEEEEGEDGVWI